MMQEVTENIIDACGQRKRQIILFLSNLILISHFGLVSFASCLASNSNTQMQFSLLILPLTHESSSYRYVPIIIIIHNSLKLVFILDWKVFHAFSIFL
ncbi:hypothetical protein AAZX31_02G271000 [Glycine max]